MADFSGKRSKVDKVPSLEKEMSKAEKEALKADEKKRKQLEKDKAKVSLHNQI
jgi:hypothetical protein